MRCLPWFSGGADCLSGLLLTRSCSWSVSHQAHFNLISLEIVEAIHPLPSRSSGLIPRCSQARRETLSLRVLGMPLGFLLVGCAWNTSPWLGCLTRRQPNFSLKESPDTPEDKTYFFRLCLRSRSFETQSWRP